MQLAKIVIIHLVLLCGCAAAQGATLVAVGDISTCGKDQGAKLTAKLTADIIAGAPSAKVALLGDIAYEHGTTQEFGCFDNSWGSLKPKLYPAPGNHEYYTAGAKGYFDYFGKRAGNPKQGYYAFTMGKWQILSLNSNCDAVGCTKDSAQAVWLKKQLKKKYSCRLAFWHHPRFSTALHGDNPAMQDLWAMLANAGTDVVLAGHDHVYERFNPMNAQGQADDKGMRAFTVGTGGRHLYGFRSNNPNSAFKQNTSLGVLKLTLEPNSYSWQFINQDGKPIDAGSGACQ